MVRWLPLLLVACSTTPRTEVILVVDSDLSVPSELDQIDVTVTGPDMRMESSMALLGDDQPPLPRTLGIVHGGGELGPFRADVTGRVGGVAVVSRSATFEFIRRETLVLTMHLVRSCIGVTCGAGTSCGERGCESLDRMGLPVWTGTPPRLGDQPDAGPADVGVDDAGVDAFDSGVDANIDACAPVTEICDNGVDDDCDMATDEGADEVCNGADDDCDTMIDEGLGTDETCNMLDDDCDMMIDEDFDLLTDPMNCGTCSRQCLFRNGEGICNAGDCQITSCDAGFDDCDDNDDNGCETDLSASDDHCGACNNRCSGSRTCCASTSTCLRPMDCT